MTKEEVLQLEKELSFQEFNNHDAYQLGQIIVDHIEKNHLKNVRIRIVLDKDIVFQYLMNGKKGDQWLNRKQNTVELFKLPTYQIWQENERSHCYQQYTNDERYVICGGAYPIIVGKGMTGSVIVSGLAHNEDHQIIVDVLSKYHDEKNKI